MNTDDGRVYDQDFINQFIPPKEQGHFIPVDRELTALEELTRKIEMESPCGCGSGKTFADCCKTDPKKI